MTGAVNGWGDRASAPGDAAAAESPAAASGLRRFARPPRRASVAAAEERCELCGERLGAGHSHMVDLQHRSIACACRACALLFTRPGGRYRTVPDRVRHDPAAPLTDAEWAELQIPVGIAFFFFNSALGRVVASYPSPAGVTECELDLAAWDRLAADHPLLRAPAPDVEAILVVGGAPREAGPDRDVPRPHRRLLLAGRRAAAGVARLRRRGRGEADTRGPARQPPRARPPA